MYDQDEEIDKDAQNKEEMPETSNLHKLKSDSFLQDTLKIVGNDANAPTEAEEKGVADSIAMDLEAMFN